MSNIAIVDKQTLKVLEVLSVSKFDKKYLKGDSLTAKIAANELIAIAYPEDLKANFSSEELKQLIGKNTLERGLEIMLGEDNEKKRTTAKPKKPVAKKKATKKAPTKAPTKLKKKSAPKKQVATKKRSKKNLITSKAKGLIDVKLKREGKKINKTNVMRECIARGYDFTKTNEEVKAILGTTTTKGSFEFTKSKVRNEL